MSAKERMAAFQSKAEGNGAPVKKSVQGPRKIGKLNIPGQKPAADEKPAKAAPKKKVIKKKVKKTDVNANTSPADESKPEVAGSKEVKVASEEVRVSSEEEVKVSSEEVSVTSDEEVKVVSDEKVKVTSEEVKAASVEVKVVSEEVKIVSEEVKVVSEEIKVTKEEKTSASVIKATPSFKDTDLDLSVELEANVNLASPVAAVAAPVTAQTTSSAVPAPEPQPTAMAPCEGRTMTVAGIPPPGSKQEAAAGVVSKTKETMKQEEKPAVKEPVKDTKPPNPQAGVVEGKPAVVAGVAPKASAAKPEPKPAVAKAAAKPAVEVKEAAAEPPREVRKRPPQAAIKKEIKAIPEEFFDNLFYFSGMGTVVGSALSKGVYVPVRNTSMALDVEFIESYEALKDEEIARGVRVVKKARNEAVDLAEELRKLQALLSGLPTFGADAGQTSVPRMPTLPPLSAIPARRVEVPALDLISKRVQSVAKDIPAAPRPPQPPMPRPVMQMSRPQAPVAPRPMAPPAPVRSAFTPVKAPTAAAPVWAPVEHRVPPISGPPSTAGVFKGMTNGANARPQQSWQTKYAGKHVTDAQAPKPFGAAGGSGGEIPSGLKPWELSRLRGLEARGYEFSHEKTLSGADHSDAFYHGGSQMSTGSDVAAADDDIASYAPFLVSSRSKKQDRAHMLHHDAVSGASFTPAHLMTTAMHQHVMTSSQRMLASPALSAEVPYCDL